MSNREDVLRLLTELPPEGRRRYMPATDEIVDAFERQYALPVPNDLREWLCIYAQRNDLNLFGLPANKPREGIAEILDIRRGKWPEDWLPVAGDGCGSYYILDLRQTIGTSRPVFFWDHETDYVRLDYIVASSLWSFLRFFLLDQLTGDGLDSNESLDGETQDEFYWPFDQARVLADDPALADYRGPVPFPWDEG